MKEEVEQDFNQPTEIRTPQIFFNRLYRHYGLY